MISDEHVRRQLRLGEDGRWEFKQIRFRGNKPVSPSRNDLADEIGAFANASGGILLCGVTDFGEIQGMSREKLVALDKLLVEVCTDSIDPPLRIQVHHKELDGLAFIMAEIPKGEALHSRDGQAFIRVGGRKSKLGGDEKLRLAQNRAQNRYLWFDKQTVSETRKSR